MKPLFLLFSAFLCLSSPAHSAKNLDTNQRILKAHQILQASYLKGGDIKALDKLISNEATITYQVADQKRQRTKADFLETIQKIHQENVQSVKFLAISCKAIGSNQVLVTQRSIHKRKGTGLNESGPGTYLVDDKATYTFVESDGTLKASRMDHNYTKTKVD